MDWLIKPRKILVAGDSWAESAWDFSDRDHRGLSTFFQNKGYTVHNIGQGGISNFDIVDRVESFLTTPDNKISDVIVFLTCPLRDLQSNCGWIRDIDQWADQNFYTALNRLSVLSSKFGINCYVVGGLGDIPEFFDKDFSQRVKISVHSFSRLLSPGYKKFRYGDVKNVEYIPYTKQRLDVMAAIETKLNFFKANRNLFPDWAHPNIAGHKILFDYLTKNYF